MTNMETEYTYEELKDLCKRLFVRTQFIFGLTYMTIPVKMRQHVLDEIHEAAGDAYNLMREAEKKGLWK